MIFFHFILLEEFITSMILWKRIHQINFFPLLCPEIPMEKSPPRRWRQQLRTSRTPLPRTVSKNLSGTFPKIKVSHLFSFFQLDPYAPHITWKNANPQTSISCDSIVLLLSSNKPNTRKSKHIPFIVFKGM